MCGGFDVSSSRQPCDFYGFFGEPVLFDFGRFSHLSEKVWLCHPYRPLCVFVARGFEPRANACANLGCWSTLVCKLGVVQTWGSASQNQSSLYMTYNISSMRRVAPCDVGVYRSGICRLTSKHRRGRLSS